MELAQLAGAFLGGSLFGGVVVKVVESFLADRTARRIELRPIDRGRIGIVRDGVWQVFYAQVSREQPKATLAEVAPRVAAATFELGDMKLVDDWIALVSLAGDVGLFETARPLVGTTAKNELATLEVRLFARLNKLERRR